MTSTRRYTMTARAEAAEETRRRILQAAFDLQSRRLASEIVLDAVAEEAGISVRTVLRHFGSRAGLFDAAVAFANELVSEERGAPVGNVPEAVRRLVDHYELRGDMALMIVAQESTYPHVRTISEAGKATHRAWVRTVFAPSLERLPGGARDEAVDLLVVATDVHAWKLLRHDRGLSRSQTEHRILTLVEAVLTAIATPDRKVG